MAPGGPAVLDAIRKVSTAPLHSVIYTHGHVDHAYGAWALVEAGEKFEVIAHEDLVPRFERYIRLRGSVAKYMSQPLEQLPASRDDLVWPTRTFRDRLELAIGGETFVLQHHRGETDDQLYVWVPERKALASADYYQGFLPNAGNGKRVQRHPEEWAVALREMAALEPEILLPAHGEALTDPETIRENLLVLAETLQYIVDHTIAGLNAGLRKDEIHASLQLPEHLANHPTMNVQYVSPQDISKMVIRQYTGWWDDLPSDWTPAPLAEQARAIVDLAGGMTTLVARARAELDGDLRLASLLADWAFLADPADAEAQQLVIDVYERRILDENSNTQEMLIYIDAMAAARRAQLDATRVQR
jgi:alkyl sulfatase BDS1-like metallo-beta-lactamase superfamily hydrolase